MGGLKFNWVTLQTPQITRFIKPRLQRRPWPYGFSCHNTLEYGLWNVLWPQSKVLAFNGQEFSLLQSVPATTIHNIEPYTTYLMFGYTQDPWSIVCGLCAYKNSCHAVAAFSALLESEREDLTNVRATQHYKPSSPEFSNPQ